MNTKKKFVTEKSRPNRNIKMPIRTSFFVWIFIVKIGSWVRCLNANYDITKTVWVLKEALQGNSMIDSVELLQLADFLFGIMLQLLSLVVLCFIANTEDIHEFFCLHDL